MVMSSCVCGITFICNSFGWDDITVKSTLVFLDLFVFGFNLSSNSLYAFSAVKEALIESLLNIVSIVNGSMLSNASVIMLIMSLYLLRILILT